MTGRFLRFATSALLAASYAAPVYANWFTEFWADCGRSAERRACWPQPFVCPDREAVREPFVTMVANGWQQQNLLGEFYFEPGTGRLNVAAQEKIRWIVNSAPPQHRTVYVHAAETPQETSARIESTQQYVARVAPEGPMPAVVATNLTEPGWPAERVDSITRKFQSSTPVPRLPKMDTSGTGTSGSGGSP